MSNHLSESPSLDQLSIVSGAGVSSVGGSAAAVAAGSEAAVTAKPKRLRLKALLMKYHYWLGWIVIIPWAFENYSGMLMQVRYEVPWVMPPLQAGVGNVPQIEYVQVLETAQQTPNSGVDTCEDVSRMYVYPN